MCWLRSDTIDATRRGGRCKCCDDVVIGLLLVLVAMLLLYSTIDVMLPLRSRDNMIMVLVLLVLANCYQTGCY
jgi:hypothetical protein